ncbi:tetratricopeptide repeat protein [Geothrix edaphica]|uniref:tetratricopeptide repeat protein n=1 Tax=Geothrix edaphica TaxID=2927976 RepID=UPI0025521565|nr:tetratricopeptide repeat-containing glycosyltransferase family protein [Geothrix edaphica]
MKAPHAAAAGALVDAAWRLFEQGDGLGATRLCEDALRLDDHHPDALHVLAVAQCQLGNLDRARTLCLQALEVRPGHLNTLNSLGNILRTGLRFDEAIEAFRRALALNPRFPQAHLNLGITYWQAGRLEDSFRCSEAALKLDPSFAEAHYNHALHLLQRGDFAQGWQEFGWRWRAPGVAPRHGFTQPRWKGEDFRGRTLLVHAEQGLGDTLQFIRFVPQVAGRGGTVRVACPRELVALLGPALPGIQVLDEGAALPPFDLQCPLMDLPGVLRTTGETLPTTTPYLFAQEDAVTSWRGRFAGAGLKVGLVWRGGFRYALDAMRSLSLETLAPLAEVEGVRFVSLQKELLPAEAETPLLARCDAAGPDLPDFAATAAAVAALDLVISVDTAVAHLAGALGRPTWLLLPHPSDWRWGLEASSTVWYPSLRLFRQDQAGDWTGVVHRVTRDIRALATETQRPA